MTVTALALIGLCSMIGCIGDPVPVRVIVKEAPVGRIALGTGWNTWDHWWMQYVPRFRLMWNDDQWAAYLSLLKESGADWIRLDLYYGLTEPRNDNDDPEVVNWAAFTFDSPRLKSLYKHLDFSQANGIDVYLVYTYLRSNHEYNANRLTGWLSEEAVSKGFPELWTRPRDEPVDRRELAENLAATTYYLIKKGGYTCIKQVSLYVEPDNGRITGSQWKNVDGYQDTFFLMKLLTKLGIRDQVAILAPHSGMATPEAWPPQGGAYDVHAVEDYESVVDWAAPQEGLKNFYPIYKTMVKEAKRKNLSKEVALVEYGRGFFTSGADNPLPAYLGTLSNSCLVFELYNSGFAGVQRWAFEPIYHPYFGVAVMKVEDVPYPSTATEVIPETTTPIIKAMEQGAKVVKVPYTFEPQRLVNTNLHRGSTIYQVGVNDPAPPGKGVCAIAAKDKEGKWHIGLINLYANARHVEVVFHGNALPGRLHWDYYDAPRGLLDRVHDRLGDHMPHVEPLRFLFRATRFSIRKVHQILGVSTFPQNSLEGSPPQLANNTLLLKLTARSLNFLSEKDGAEIPEVMN